MLFHPPHHLPPPGLRNKLNTQCAESPFKADLLAGRAAGRLPSLEAPQWAPYWLFFFFFSFFSRFHRLVRCLLAAALEALERRRETLPFARFLSFSPKSKQQQKKSSTFCAVCCYRIAAFSSAGLKKRKSASAGQLFFVLSAAITGHLFTDGPREVALALANVNSEIEAFFFCFFFPGNDFLFLSFSRILHVDDDPALNFPFASAAQKKTVSASSGSPLALEC